MCVHMYTCGCKRPTSKRWCLPSTIQDLGTELTQVTRLPPLSFLRPYLDNRSALEAIPIHLCRTSRARQHGTSKGKTQWLGWGHLGLVRKHVLTGMYNFVIKEQLCRSLCCKSTILATQAIRQEDSKFKVNVGSKVQGELGNFVRSRL